MPAQVLSSRIPVGSPAMGRLLLPAQQGAGGGAEASLSAAVLGEAGGGRSEVSASVPASEAGTRDHSLPECVSSRTSNAGQTRQVLLEFDFCCCRTTMECGFTPS